MQGCAFVNGQYVAPEQATVSVFDWGFLHSDATYDVAHVWQGRFFRLEDHLDRFFANLQRLRLNAGLSRGEVRDVMHGCVARAGLADAYVEVLCTRGLPQPGSRDPRSCQNRFMAFAIPFVWIASPAQQQAGLNLVVTERVRIAPASVDPRIKNYHWLDMTMALFDAYERGGDTAVLVDGHGHITEGPGFNVFAVVDGVLCTPDAGVLEGISRRTVLELAEAAGLPLHVGPLSVEALRRAQEIFLSSTGGGVIAVARLDGRPIGAGADVSGETTRVTEHLQRAYWALHDDPRCVQTVQGLNP